MIDHLSIGVGDVSRSKVFYDAVLAPLGYRCLSQDAASLGYGQDSIVLWVNHSRSPVPADPESGLHICFAAPTRGSVAEFHAAAVANGGTDNGGPGLREDYGPNYYAAFVIDPDGYRIEAHCGAQAREA
jgi:catechol 2,3-dioxygenase-like lactoylglutathione lyase family enzyme